MLPKNERAADLPIMEIGHPSTAPLAHNSATTSINVVANLVTTARTEAQSPTLLDIQPGDSAAVIAIKIRAFTLNTLLEILEATPLDTLTKEGLKKIVTDVIVGKPAKQPLAGEGLALKPEVSDANVAQRALLSRSEQTIISDPTLHTNQAPHSANDSLSIAVQPHTLSSATLRALGDAFDTTAITRLTNATNTAFALAENDAFTGTTAPSGLASVLPKLLSLVEQSSADLLSPETRGSDAAQKILDELIKDGSDKPSLRPGTNPKYTATEWKVLVALQDFASEALDTNLTLRSELNPFGESAIGIKTANDFSSRVAAREFREIFFSTLEAGFDGTIGSTVDGTVKNRPNGGAAGAQSILSQTNPAAGELSKLAEASSSQLTALISSAANQVSSNLAGIQLIANNQNLALNALVSALAARLVVAHRLTKDGEVYVRRDKLKRKSTAQTQTSWLLRFAGNSIGNSVGNSAGDSAGAPWPGSEVHSVILSKESGPKARFSARFEQRDAKPDDDNSCNNSSNNSTNDSAANNLAANLSAQRITEQLGLSWFSWVGAK